jgi:hypothetical protein
MLASAAAVGAEPVKLGALGLTGLGVPPDKLQYYSEHFAQQLSLRGLRVVTQAELAAMLGLERQKQLMGCAGDGSSCTAEITEALGVDGVVTGSLGFQGDEFQLDIKVVAAGGGPPLSVYSRRARTKVILDELALASWQVAVEVLQVLRPALPPPPRPQLEATTASSGPSSLRHLAWIPIALSPIIALVSVPFFLDAKNHHQMLTQMPSYDFYFSTPQATAAAGNSSQSTAAAFVATGAALMAIGIFVFTWFTLQ